MRFVVVDPSQQPAIIVLSLEVNSDEDMERLATVYDAYSKRTDKLEVWLAEDGTEAVTSFASELMAKRTREAEAFEGERLKRIEDFNAALLKSEDAKVLAFVPSEVLSAKEIESRVLAGKPLDRRDDGPEPK